MTSRRRYERRNQPDEVVVHVAGVPKGGSRSGHDVADDRVQLPYRGGRDTEAVHLEGKITK